MKDIEFKSTLIKKQSLKNKKYSTLFFLMVICFIGNCFVVESSAISVIKKIIKLEKENQALNEKIITKLRFELYKDKTLGGETCKYLLRNKESGELWLFKKYESLGPVNSTIVTYRLAQLLGVDISEIIRTVLPINERMQYGSIQKIIPGVKKINSIPFSRLSSEQITSIMKNRVLDWLVFNSDTDKDEFLVEIETGKIIAIDKDETFYDEKSSMLTDNTEGDSYYYEFWEAYSKGEFIISEVNLKEIFKLIDYIQCIKDKDITYIINDLLKNVKDSSELEFIIKRVLSRKNSLRVNFKNFYKNLLEKQNCFFQIPLVDKDNTYARTVLKRLEESVFQKKTKLAQLTLMERGKQETIKRISCSDAWYLIERLNYVSREKFFSLAEDIFNKLNYLRKRVPSVFEKFIINLYLEKLINIQNKRGMENFIQREIKEIVLYPDQITNSKILNIEYNLKAIYGDSRGEFNKYKEAVVNNPRNILFHLDCFLYPIKDEDYGERDLIVKEYKKRLETNPDDLIDKLLYGIALRNDQYVRAIDGDFAWKYLGLSLIYSSKERRRKAIEECKKTLHFKKSKKIAYETYMFLGLLYEHNDRWERFGEWCEVEKACNAYKKAIAINPENVKAHLNLGILYLMMDQPNKALKEFKKVNKLDSQYGKKHFHLDKINKKSSYKNKKEYLNAVRMNTLSGRNHYILGLAYLIKEDKNLAQRHFNKAKEFGYIEKIDPE